VKSIINIIILIMSHQLLSAIMPAVGEVHPSARYIPNVLFFWN